MPYQTPNRGYPVPRDGEESPPDGVDGPLNTVGTVENWGDSWQTAMSMIDADIEDIENSAIQTDTPLTSDIDMGGYDIQNGGTISAQTLSGAVDTGGSDVQTGGGNVDAGTGEIFSGDTYMDNGAGNACSFRFRDGGTNRFGFFYNPSTPRFYMHQFGVGDIMEVDPSDSTANFPTADLQNRGSRVLTEADEGHGNGLDADTVDGRDIYDGDTEPADWDDGDVWLKPL